MAGEEIGAAYVKIGVDSSGLKSGLAGARKETTAFSKTATSQFGGIGKSLAGIAGPAAIATVAIAGLGVALTGAAQAAIAWESVGANIKKTAGAATDVEALSAALLNMSMSIPLAAGELGEIAAIAGQLGVDGTANVLAFTETIAMASVAFDMLPEAAASSLAKMINLFEAGDVTKAGNLASSINTIANSMAATEPQIMAAMSGMAGLGAQYGMTGSEAAALSGKLIALGMDGAKAGTLTSSLMTQLTDPTKWGDAADMLDMTADAFGRLITSDIDEGLLQIAEHLASIVDLKERAEAIADLGLGIEAAKPLNKMLMDVEGIRDAMKLSQQAYEENVSLQEEANAKFGTTAAKLQLIQNAATAIAIDLGDWIINSNVFIDALDTILTSLKTIAEFDFTGAFASLKEKLSFDWEPKDISADINRRAANLKAYAKAWAGGTDLSFVQWAASGAKEYVAAFDEGIEPLSGTVEEELEEVDAEGAGTNAGEDYGKAASVAARASWDEGFSDWDKGRFQYSESMMSETDKKYETRSWEMGGKQFGYRKRVGGQGGTNLYIEGVLIGEGHDTSPEELLIQAGLPVPEEATAAYWRMVGDESKAHILELNQNLRAGTAAMEPINPYETWGSAAHLADWKGANKDLIEAVGKDLSGRIYSFSAMIGTAGSDAMQDAWETILDPDAAVDQVAAAFDVMAAEVGPLGVELMQDVRASIETGAADLDLTGLMISFEDAIAEISGAGLGNIMGDGFIDGFIDTATARNVLNDLVDLFMKDPDRFQEAGGEAAIGWWNGFIKLMEERDEILLAPVLDEAALAKVNAELIELTQDQTINVSLLMDYSMITGPGMTKEEIADFITTSGIEDMPTFSEQTMIKPFTADIQYLTDFGINPFNSELEESISLVERFTAMQKLAIDTTGVFSEEHDRLLTNFDKSNASLQDVIDLYTALNKVNTDIATSAAEIEKPYYDAAKSIWDCGDACKSCQEAMSEFGIWQESEAARFMFKPSYIGPQSLYPSYQEKRAAEEAAMIAEQREKWGLDDPATDGVGGADQIKMDVSVGGTASADIETLITSATAAQTMPITANTDGAMASITALNTAASAPMSKTITVNTVYTGGGPVYPGYGIRGVPAIPMASGGIVSSPIHAIVGDASTPEVVAPMGDLIPMIRAAVSGGAVNVGTLINVEGNITEESLPAMREIAREAVDDLEVRISRANRNKDGFYG